MRKRDASLALFVACATLALTWPGYALLGARIEPYVLGLPFSLFWVAAWVVLTFVAVGLYHLGRGTG